MLTPYKPQFVEQIFTDQTGRQFRLVFLVSFVDGRLKGQLVSATPVASRKAQFSSFNDQFLLPITCEQNVGDTEYVATFTPIVSPYNELFFFTSQPTRAPSIK